jgi:hypothetical protein
MLGIAGRAHIFSRTVSPQCPRSGFFVTLTSLNSLSSKTVARFGSSAPLISNSQLQPTFFTLPSEL